MTASNKRTSSAQRVETSEVRTSPSLTLIKDKGSIYQLVPACGLANEIERIQTRAFVY